MVQDKSQYSSSYRPQQADSKATFGSAQKMKSGTTTTGSNTFGKKDDHSKANGAWGQQFKSRDHFVSMHFS